MEAKQAESWSVSGEQRPYTAVCARFRSPTKKKKPNVCLFVRKHHESLKMCCIAVYRGFGFPEGRKFLKEVKIEDLFNTFFFFWSLHYTHVLIHSTIRGRGVGECGWGEVRWNPNREYTCPSKRLNHHHIPKTRLSRMLQNTEIEHLDP